MKPVICLGKTISIKFLFVKKIIYLYEQLSNEVDHGGIYGKTSRRIK